MSEFRRLIAKLAKKKQSLALGESCTGGLMAFSLTSVPGASKVFVGGVVSYANSSKTKFLKVPKRLIERKGAVSNEVASKMASGAAKLFGADWGVGVTGIAGPTGGTKYKPVGTVCIALVGPQIEVVHRMQFKGSRRKIQEQSVQYAARLLLDEV